MALFFFQLMKFKGLSFDIKLGNCGVVVKSIGYFSADAADGRYHACYCSNSFNFHTTFSSEL